MSETRIHDPVDNTVREVPVPPASRLSRLFARVDFADAYAVSLPPNASSDPEQLGRFILGNQAPWVAMLMSLRDTMVAGFGLKTARQLRQPGGAPEDRRIHIFKIYEANEREILLGEDDAHLDFRISVMCRPSGSVAVGAQGAAPREVVVSTVVSCHNRLGRGYIKLIAPFHRVIVKDSLQRSAASGWPQRPCSQAQAEPMAASSS
jgi:hypothetical protein